MERKRLGLIVNPIAGIGGRVGLKGSDGLEVQERARSLGAVPLAGERAAAALESLRPLAARVELLTAPGEMGEAIARQSGFTPRVLSIPCAEASKTTADDTRQAARTMRELGADLILFAGGDGTARDMYAAIRNDFPVLGIPAGVKIHSAAYAVTPRSAGTLAVDFLNGRVRLREVEVLDLDEASYRKGQIITHLYGYLKVPYRREMVQNQKVPTPASETVQAQAIAEEIVEQMKMDMAYVLGPGTTTRAVAERLGLPKTLVGVDIMTRKELLAADVGEREILEMLAHRPLGLIITPTGGQGFLLGRGNQQISPEVIRRVGRGNILIICLATKIASLQGQPLLVDTGDQQVDRLLAGYVQVITGYHEKIIYKVVC